MRILIGHACDILVGTWDDFGNFVASYNLREIKGVRIGCSATKSDGTTRNNRGWKRTIQGLKELDIAFNALHSDVAVDENALQWLAGYFASGNVLGAELRDDKDVPYIRAPFICTDFPRDEDLDNPVQTAITLNAHDAPRLWQYLTIW